ncbi:MAG: F0F1 ATP synthase subunit delta [Campylobacterota bacterium]
MEVIAKKYIKALTDGVGVATKKEYYGVLSGFAAAYSDPKVNQVLNSPLTSSKKKMELVEAISAKMDTAMQNFMKLIAQNGRFHIIPDLANILRLQLQKDSNQYEGVVQSSKTLSADEIQSLQQSLSAKTGTNIVLHQVSSEYDGIKVTIKDLGIEVGYSKERVKEKLLDYIAKSF